MDYRADASPNMYLPDWLGCPPRSILSRCGEAGIAAVAVSVETLVSIVIGCSYLEGCGFDSHYRPCSFLRFNFRPIVSSPY